MKVYFSIDLEGISSIVGSYQCPHDGAPIEVKRAVTEEVNAAIRGAKAGGATEILINENHSGRDLIIDMLDPSVEILIGKPKPLYTIDCLDESFDCIFMIGLHPRAGTCGGVLDHTWTTKCVMELRINNKPVGELGLNALIASYYKVPIVLVTGDDKMKIEALDLLGEIECSVVKIGLDRYSARIKHPSVILKEIEESAKRAMTRIHQIPPPKFELPIIVEIDYENTAYARRASYIPTVELVGPRTVRYSSDNEIEAFKTFIAAAALPLGVFDKMF